MCAVLTDDTSGADNNIDAIRNVSETERQQPRTGEDSRSVGVLYAIMTRHR
jgi:hypothetical protein